jgi:hypothetical protein
LPERIGAASEIVGVPSANNLINIAAAGDRRLRRIARSLDELLMEEKK